MKTARSSSHRWACHSHGPAHRRPARRLGPAFVCAGGSTTCRTNRSVATSRMCALRCEALTVHHDGRGQHGGRERSHRRCFHRSSRHEQGEAKVLVSTPRVDALQQRHETAPHPRRVEVAGNECDPPPTVDSVKHSLFHNIALLGESHGQHHQLDALCSSEFAHKGGRTVPRVRVGIRGHRRPVCRPSDTAGSRTSSPARTDTVSRPPHTPHATLDQLCGGMDSRGRYENDQRAGRCPMRYPPRHRPGFSGIPTEQELGHDMRDISTD